jgi:hypothetical protein
MEHAGNSSAKCVNVSEGRGGNRLDHLPSGNAPCAVKRAGNVDGMSLTAQLSGNQKRF